MTKKQKTLKVINFKLKQSLNTNKFIILFFVVHFFLFPILDPCTATPENC